MTDLPSKPPKAELSAADSAQARRDKLIKSLDKFSRITRGTQHRMLRLVLFGEGKSDKEWRDHPLLQIVIERRNQHDKLSRTIEVAHDQIHNITDPDVLADALSDLARLEGLRQKHLDAIESALSTLTKDLSQAAGTMARILSDAQRLELGLRAQEAKERQVGRTRSSDISDDDINFVLEDDAPEA